jgi:hypothetical protein
MDDHHGGELRMSNSHDLDAGTTTVKPIAASAPSGPGTGFIIRKLTWSAALLAMGAFAVDGFFTFYMQTSAPQQAAAAAAACFHMIAPYVIARAIDELTRVV